jgi:hypothetical protein
MQTGDRVRYAIPSHLKDVPILRSRQTVKLYKGAKQRKTYFKGREMLPTLNIDGDAIFLEGNLV